MHCPLSVLFGYDKIVLHLIFQAAAELIQLLVGFLIILLHVTSFLNMFTLFQVLLICVVIDYSNFNHFANIEERSTMSLCVHYIISQHLLIKSPLLLQLFLI
jgi:hypothetical protein